MLLNLQGVFQQQGRAADLAAMMELQSLLEGDDPADGEPNP
jgi:hypothetical protein